MTKWPLIGDFLKSNLKIREKNRVEKDLLNPFYSFCNFKSYELIGCAMYMYRMMIDCKIIALYATYETSDTKSLDLAPISQYL